jgi:enoyl-CoA hydratase/carnithine racemase
VDTLAAAQLIKDKVPNVGDFFKQEYQLNHLVGVYKMPYIALLDGITSES